VVYVSIYRTEVLTCPPDAQSPEREIAYRHIDLQATEVVDRKLLPTHWQNLLPVVLSIRDSSISPVTLLCKLGHGSQKNGLYQSFRELGGRAQDLFAPMPG